MNLFKSEKELKEEFEIKMDICNSCPDQDSCWLYDVNECQRFRYLKRSFKTLNKYLSKDLPKGG